MKISILTTSINFPSNYPPLTYDYYATLLNLIKGVKKELRIATYLIDREMLSIIEKELLRKNKEVKLIIDKSNSQEIHGLIEDLQSKYVNFYVKIWKKETIFHLKLLIFDNNKVIIGSHNLTYGAHTLNVEMSILIEDDTGSITSKFTKIFDYIFEIYN